VIIIEIAQRNNLSYLIYFDIFLNSFSFFVSSIIDDKFSNY